MSPEAQVEMLSAYLDGELRPEEEARVENLLERDPEARRQLEGMRSMVADLRHLERLAPPPTLGQDVVRRIALVGERRSLLDRIEDGLSGLQQQSNTFLMFAVVFALAAIMYFFAHGLERARESLVPVTFDDPAESAESATGSELTPGAQGLDEIKAASTVVVAGRLFQRLDGGPWVEDGLSVEQIAGARKIDLQASPEWLHERPELGGVALLGHFIVRLEGEVVEVWSPPADGE